MATFSEFAAIWEKDALSQHKLSKQLAVRSHLKKWLFPYFGEMQLRSIGGETIQAFINSTKLSAKTRRNMVLTLRMIWKSAKGWGFVAHDPFEGVVLPKVQNQSRIFFTLEQLQRIIGEADEPCRTLYWLAGETGMRAGELCGLTLDNVNLDTCVINVKQSVWRGKLQAPKTTNSIRSFAISNGLAAHLRIFLESWRANALRLLFATSKGTPWDQNLVVKRKLHPLLDRLGIQRCGLHAFRHTSSSLMDWLNAPLRLRQERLGHVPGSDLTLGVYTHVVGNDDHVIANKLGDILRPVVSKSEPERFSQEAEVSTVEEDRLVAGGGFEPPTFGL